MSTSPCSSDVLALDETTLDPVARKLPILRYVKKGAVELLPGKLAGRHVLVVSTQQSDADVKSVQSDLQLAGATVTGHVTIEDNFVKPDNNGPLLDLAATTLTTNAVTGLPTNSDGVETSTALLAAALMNHVPAVPRQSQQEILAAYKGAGYIDYDTVPTGPAEAVVVLAALPYTDQDATKENQNTLTMVTGFDKAGPIVLGASSTAGSGNVVSAVRGDASLSKTVSTVDNDNTLQGALAVTLALNEQVVYGKTGHYGLASSATASLPKLPQS